ncbi:MAG: alanine racemase [Oscillospiraceae bacterium]
MKVLKRTWADISLDNLEHNYKTLREHVGKGPRFLGVVKADAYGHGAVQVSRTLEELGAEYLAVSNLEEAVQLRRGGVNLPVLILGYTPPEFAPDEAELSITQEVHGLQYAKDLNKALEGTGKKLTVHLKIDTGMTRPRLLRRPAGSLRLLRSSKSPSCRISISRAFSCTSASRTPKSRRTWRLRKLQHERFVNMLELMKSKGIEPEIRHCCNSGATILRPEYAMDMIRPGVATYGFHPSPDTVGEIDLRPMMSLHTSIAQIRTIAAGKSISYGRTSHDTGGQARCRRFPSATQTASSRLLSNRVTFRICGKEAPVVGRICMDMCMVDISDIPEAKVGTTATLFGYDENGTLLPCERIADMLGTINYEIVCDVNKRVPRFFYKDGKQVGILQYIV